MEAGGTPRPVKGERVIEARGEAVVAETRPFRIHLRDALNGAPLPAIGLRLSSGGTVEHAVVDSEGYLELQGGRRWAVACDSEDVRLLVPGEEFGYSETIQNVWAYRFYRVHGRVNLERPEAARAGTVMVAARPSTKGVLGKAGGEIGSSKWVDDLTRRQRLPWKATVVDSGFTLEVPILKDMTIGASAPGHAPQAKALPSSVPSGDVEVDFDLKVGASISVSVVDTSGQPVAGATVQYVFTFSVPSEEENYEAWRLLKRMANVGLGATSSGETGMTTVEFKASRGTDRNGRAALSQVVGSAEPGKFILMVDQSGYEPYVAEVEGGGESQRSVVLARIVPASTRYRLTWQGKCVRGKAGLQLCVMIADLTLPLRPLTSDENGYFDGRLITPGQEYYGLLFDSDGLGMKMGKVVFGSSEDVDVSSWD